MLGAVGGDKRIKGLVIGAIRRVWHRHPTRLAVVRAARVEREQYKKDGAPMARPGVFYTCAVCGGLSKAQKSKDYPRMHVDHIDPVVPLDKHQEDLSWDDFIQRLFCSVDNLQILCSTCHTAKTSAERSKRV